MAAHASLVSLMHIIEQSEKHPRPPISLDQTQIQSLTQKVTFLQEFLKYHSHGGNSIEVDGLENRIADAASAAEYTIESGIVDRILTRSTLTSSVDLYQGLQKVIDDMDSIMEGVEKIKEKRSNQVHLSADPRRSTPMEQNMMVGFDDELNKIMDWLSSQQSTRQIIPIVGMGGMGKTTLARNVYLHPYVQHHFDICAWTTISQEYSNRAILRDVLYQVNKEGRGDSIEKMNTHELGERLYKHLMGRRYLVIMDDMWNIEAWEQIKFFFPSDNKNGNRIIVTTRLLPIAMQLKGTYLCQMSFLDMVKSWELFCKVVFGENGCPLELRELGKKITNGCKGLPLSIVVIGGLLARSEGTREYWEHIAENLNSVVNLDDNNRCFNILYMSYHQLPVHLKPCFLYMGVFPEDEAIHVSMLVKLWVAEGILKPVGGKSWEHVARDYLNDLIDRNLVLVNKRGSTGNIKYCSMHDLLRDLCLREAKKERFYNVVKQPTLHPATTTVRMVLPECISSHEETLNDSAHRARSLICYSGEAPSLHKFQLLRIWKTFDKDLCEGDLDFPGNISHLVNLRYIGVPVATGSDFHASVRHFWNLHTLIVNQVWGEAGASQIWEMPWLRHVEFAEIELPDPPPSDDHVEILENLQTLSRIRNFRCSEEVVKRIRNVRKLIVVYDDLEENLDYFLDNVERLEKLESFGFFSFPSGTNLFHNLGFPNSLKKLTVSHFHWEEMVGKIGSLPLLEKLKLINGYLKHRTWETFDDQFPNLKFLLIESCNMECWETQSAHFPLLKELVLRNLDKLKEIPIDVGDIPTLESIRLEFCTTKSIVISAKKITEEQYQLGNTIRVRVLLRGRNRIPRSSESPNFQVEETNMHKSEIFELSVSSIYDIYYFVQFFLLLPCVFCLYFLLSLKCSIVGESECFFCFELFIIVLHFICRQMKAWNLLII